MSGFESTSPHPRHSSFDFSSTGFSMTSSEQLALSDPELFSEAQRLAASLSAIEALEAIGVIVDCEQNDA